MFSRTRAPFRLLAPLTCALLGAPLLAGTSVATPRAHPAGGDPGAATSAPVHAMPHHDLVVPGARASATNTAKYRYAEGWQGFAEGHRPRGISARLTVHRPRQVRWRGGDHSLVELALVRPHSNPRHPSYVEAGWIRGNGSTKTRLFVFWWGLKGKPHCYNRCGFHRKGPGLKPGAVLEPGSTIKLAWIHKHHRWNLRVNGRLSGYYPDRLWKGRFTRMMRAQVFGEVATLGAGGRCTDMGNGRFPRKRHSARVWQLRLFGSTAPRPDFRRGTVTRPRQYQFRRLNPHAFRYGGTGGC